MGRGGIRGGLRVTRKEVARKLFKKIQDDMQELNRLLADDRMASEAALKKAQEALKRLAPFIGFMTLTVMDFLQDGAVNNSVLHFLRIL